MEKKMGLWYEDLYLIGSNLFILPFIFRSFYFGRFDNGLIGCGTLLTSMFYHLSQSGLFTAESFEYAQNADHIWVTLLYWNVTLRFLQFSVREHITIMGCVLLMATWFTAHLVQTSAFEVLYVVCVLFFFFFQFIARGIKLPRYGFMWFVLGWLVGMPALVFFFFNEGVNTPNYWWAHGSWHVLVMLSLSVMDLGQDYHNERLWNWIDRSNSIVSWEHS